MRRRSSTSITTGPGRTQRGPRPKTNVEQRFCALGDDAQAFLVGAAAIGNTRLAQELEILLGLGAAHGEPALVAALRRAVAFRRFRAADVRSILAAGTGTPQPRPAGDALVLDLPTAPTRSLDAYKITGTPPTGAAHDHHNRPTGCTEVDGPLPADLEAGLRRLKLAAVRRTAPKCCRSPRPSAGPPRKCCAR